MILNQYSISYCLPCRVFPSLSTKNSTSFKALYIYFLLSAISATLVRFTGLELCFWAGFVFGSASMALRLLRWLMPKAKWKTCFAFVCARMKPRNGGRAANLAVMVTAEKKREKNAKIERRIERQLRREREREGNVGRT